MGCVQERLCCRRPLDGLAHGGLGLGAGDHVLGCAALGYSHHGLLRDDDGGGGLGVLGLHEERRENEHHAWRGYEFAILAVGHWAARGG